MFEFLTDRFSCWWWPGPVHAQPSAISISSTARVGVMTNGSKNPTAASSPEASRSTTASTGWIAGSGKMAQSPQPDSRGNPHDPADSDEVRREVRYYLSSLDEPASAFQSHIRQHWSIENSCHWVLDTTFREDHNQTYIGHAAKNLGALRRIVLNPLKSIYPTPAASRRNAAAPCSTSPTAILCSP